MVDLGVADAKPMLIQAAAAASFSLDSTGTKIVYTKDNSTQDGIYVAPIP